MGSQIMAGAPQALWAPQAIFCYGSAFLLIFSPIWGQGGRSPLGAKNPQIARERARRIPPQGFHSSAAAHSAALCLQCVTGWLGCAPPLQPRTWSAAALFWRATRAARRHGKLMATDAWRRGVRQSAHSADCHTAADGNASVRLENSTVLVFHSFALAGGKSRLAEGGSPISMP